MNGANKVSRKVFFQSFFTLFKEASRTADRDVSFKLLPPGVQDETEFLQSCTECYECVAHCPHLALRVCRDEQSPFFGKPVIDPQQQPCYLCETLPCVQHCAPGALNKAFATKLNGVVWIDSGRCLTYDGLFCRTCVNACPIADEAMSVNPYGQPVVQEEQCTGCGICVSSCPVDPSAIHVKPRNRKG